MKKMFKALLALVLMVTLTACSADDIAYKKYSGTWVLSDAEIQEDETATNFIAAALAIVKLFGGEITMELKNDGTGGFGISDEKKDLKWTAKEITLDDKTYAYSVKDDQLIISFDENNTATFKKKTEKN